jgi:fluoride exporter
MQLNWMVAVLAGGGLGSLVRFAISLAIQKQAAIGFPLSTFLANVLSCMVLGLVARIGLTIPLGDAWRLFVITGFCGGLSTFSTFSYETFVLFRTGHSSWALANILLNVMVCLFILFWFLKKHP